MTELARFDFSLLGNVLVTGVIVGMIYALMAVGITFIYSIMKMINWSMGEFYMLGSYAQYVLVAHVFGSERWYLGIPVAAAGVFLLGLVTQRWLLAPMYGVEAERRDEYATIITVVLMVFFRNLATVVAGPNVYSPKEYLGPIAIGNLSISGNRAVAVIGTLVVLALFSFVVKRTWIGLALRGTAQNRVGVQTAGIQVRQMDQLAFGIGVGLAAAAGALLAPTFLVYPENGSISTLKGFEIIVIGGLGSIPGSLAAALLLGVVEKLGSVYLSSAYEHLYGFALLILLLAVRPTGLLGERERSA